MISFGAPGIVDMVGCEDTVALLYKTTITNNDSLLRVGCVAKKTRVLTTRLDSS
jgi:hypothetical protein